jgi:molybdopterin/thiamine biosynthesis adenylyltransferase
MPIKFTPESVLNYVDIKFTETSNLQALCLVNTWLKQHRKHVLNIRYVIVLLYINMEIKGGVPNIYFGDEKFMGGVS